MTESEQPNISFGEPKPETPTEAVTEHASEHTDAPVTDDVNAVEEMFADTAAIDAAVARAHEPVSVEEVIVPNESTEVAAAAAAAAQPEPDGVASALPIAATAATGWGATQAAPAPGFAEPVAQTVYVPAPIPPKPKGNRGFATLIVLIGTLVFSALYAVAAYVYMSVTATAKEFVPFLESPVYWGVVAVFFLTCLLLGVLINRGPAWTHAVFSWFIAGIVYLSAVALSLVVARVWEMNSAEGSETLALLWLSPFSIIAAIFAREVPIWFGGWIARNGRKVSARNEAAMEAYDREVAAGPLFP